MPNVVAIMQPYIFPYIGYMNLAHAADTFVFYDDVSFIKKGWINRNRILLNGSPFTFTIPLKSASQNRLIADTRTHDIQNFSERFKKQVALSYKDCKYYRRGMDYISTTLDGNSESIGAIAAASVQNFFDLLDMPKQFLASSADFSSTVNLDRAERLIAITRSLGADEYVNACGGMELYNKKQFKDSGVNLNFIKPGILPYAQPNSTQFHQGLSIIDLVMNLSREQLSEHLHSYELL